MRIILGSYNLAGIEDNWLSGCRTRQLPDPSLSACPPAPQPTHPLSSQHHKALLNHYLLSELVPACWDQHCHPLPRLLGIRCRIANSCQEGCGVVCRTEAGSTGRAGKGQLVRCVGSKISSTELIGDSTPCWTSSRQCNMQAGKAAHQRPAWCCWTQHVPPAGVANLAMLRVWLPCCLPTPPALGAPPPPCLAASGAGVLQVLSSSCYTSAYLLCRLPLRHDYAHCTLQGSWG